MQPRRPLRASTSLYLDALRLVAAMAVFLGHAKVLLFPTTRLGPLFGQSREAVAVFFVLSGFVIRFVSTERETAWPAYLTARTSRIYSVAIVSVLVTAGLDRWGSGAHPEYYAALGFYVPETLNALLSCLTFTDELWFRHAVLGTDEPYWSLGFEVWYYAFFAIVLFLRSGARVLLLVGWLCVCGPKIAAYLPLWLAGAVTYDLCSARPPAFGRRRAPFIFGATLVLYCLLWRFLSLRTANMYDPAGAGETLLTVAYLSSIGLLVAVNILAFDEMAGDRPVFGPRATQIVRWAAGGSFTLYLLHQPVLVFLSSMAPASRHPRLVGLACCVATLGLVLLAAELGERRKRVFSRAIRRVARRTAPGRGSPTTGPAPPQPHHGEAGRDP